LEEKIGLKDFWKIMKIITSIGRTAGVTMKVLNLLSGVLGPSKASGREGRGPLSTLTLGLSASPVGLAGFPNPGLKPP
jgi:hypothetical protein